MKTFLAIIMYTLSLFGIDAGSKLRIDRIQRDGDDVLYSRIVTRPAGTRLECVRSASGQCYYTVVPQDCVSMPLRGATACVRRPVERFALAGGDSRQLATLDALRVCVSADAGATPPDCD